MHQQDVKKLHEDNRKGWNEGAEAYEEDLQERIEFLRAGGQNFCPPEFEFLKDLPSWCHRAIHMQCAGGTDTLSLWNLGAHEVVGVDISDRMIAVAEEKGRALNAPAKWFRSDILETPHELDGTADLVYTGRGAICWIMDLDAWAQVVARLLKPGGKFYLYEGHPISEMWTIEDSTYVLDAEYGNYFADTSIASSGWPSTYIGDLGKPTEEHATKHERCWRLSQIVNALIGAGLTINQIEEHPDVFWDRYPNMPSEMVSRLPQTLSILASK